MQSGETVGTGQLDGTTPLDLLRWLLAIVIVGSVGVGGLLLARNWTPPPREIAMAEPAILLELEPMAEIAPPEPVAEPVPEPVMPEPQPAPPTPEIKPEPLPLPSVMEPEPQAEPVEPPPEPIVEPPPSREPPVEPEPVPEPPASEPLAEPEVPTVASPMPVTMSASLQQQREDTPATNPRPPRAAPKPTTPPAQQAETPRSTPRQNAPQPSQPGAASGPLPAEWRAQVLRHIDRRKIYPRDAQRAGQEGVVAIAFTIDASGRVLSASVARSSGFPSLDQAALETARRASPVPKPPSSLGSSVSLTASIRFALR